MKRKLEQFYAKKDKKVFRTGAILLFLLADIVVLSYLYTKFSDRELFSHAFKQGLELQGVSAEGFDDDFVKNLWTMFHRTLVLIIAMAASAHLAIYIFWTKEKRFALAYIKMLSGVGGPLLILWGMALLTTKLSMALVFIGMGIAVLALLPGIRLHETKRPAK